MANLRPPYVGAQVLACRRSLARGPAGARGLTALLPMTITHVHENGSVDGVAITADPGAVGHRMPYHILRACRGGRGWDVEVATGGGCGWRPERRGD